MCCMRSCCAQNHLRYAAVQFGSHTLANNSLGRLLKTFFVKWKDGEWYRAAAITLAHACDSCDYSRNSPALTLTHALSSLRPGATA